MKRMSKWIIGVVVLVAIFLLASQGLNYYLKGPKKPINAILVGGETEDVKEAKEIYKDNTKYTKDYKYKMVTKEVTGTADDGQQVTTIEKKILFAKDTVKSMIKDQAFRVNVDGNIDLNTELLTEMPNIDSNKSIILGSEYDKKINEIDINGVNIPVVYGCYSWIGYLPSEGRIVIMDDNMYASMDGKELDMSLIRLKKSNLDLRNIQDQTKIKNELSDVSDNIEINYTNIKD